MRECHRCGVELRPGQFTFEYVRSGYTDGFLLGQADSKLFAAEHMAKVPCCKNCARTIKKERNRVGLILLVVAIIILIPFSVLGYNSMVSDPKYTVKIENLIP